MKIEELQALLKTCSDGNCIFSVAPKTGMHTNGGCHCTRNMDRYQLGRNIRLMQQELRELYKSETQDKDADEAILEAMRKQGWKI